MDPATAMGIGGTADMVMAVAAIMATTEAITEATGAKTV